MNATAKNNEIMEKFNDILDLARTLQGPDGCPWDRKQTLMSLRQNIVEEVYELIEAINLEDKEKLVEELGDVFFTSIFILILAERTKIFNPEEVLESISSKIIRRHPHIFGDDKALDENEALMHWERMKKQEKSQKKRKSVLDSIPKDLPALARAQEMLIKFQQKKCLKKDSSNTFSNEEELGEALLSIVDKAQSLGLDAENSLRRVLSIQEKEFREKERKTNIFEGLADVYHQARPSYPKETLDDIHKYCAPKNKKITILDIGSGTGIFTRSLAERFQNEYLKIIGLEPCSEMRKKALQNIENNNITFIEGVAENLHFDDHSIDLVSVAQALHWFDRPKFYSEVKRVLVSGGCFVIIDNSRDWRNSPFLSEYEDILEEFVINSDGTHHSRTYREYKHTEELQNFFSEIKECLYRWNCNMTEELFLTRASSTSLVKRAIENVGKNTVIERIKETFNKYSDNNNTITVPYETKLLLSKSY